MVAAYTLRTETTGIRPEFELDTTSERDAVETGDDQWIKRAREINARARRRFTLRWREGSEAQRQQLELAFVAVNGPTLPMNYTMINDIDANAIEVFFVEDSYKYERVSAVAYAMEVQIEEGR